MIAALHLDDHELQSLADGTFRGPEGLAARGHCDACAECAAGLSAYASLTSHLSALVDPALPDDFTSGVLRAVDARELLLAQRRHTWLAAIPAAALALFAVVGWSLSAASDYRVDQLVSAFALGRHLVAALGSVLDAARLPLGLGALAFTVAIFTLLTRTIRAGQSPDSIAQS